MEDCAHAFAGEIVLAPLSLQTLPSGVEYDGTYSGSYGNFGAMAIPLHPEAKSSDVDAKYKCTLREPMIKVIHSVSAVEYRDAHNEPIVFRQFQDVFGQFPFLAPRSSTFTFLSLSFSESEGGAMSGVHAHVHVACLQLLRLMDLRSKRKVLWSSLRTSWTWSVVLCGFAWSVGRHPLRRVTSRLAQSGARYSVCEVPMVWPCGTKSNSVLGFLGDSW